MDRITKCRECGVDFALPNRSGSKPQFCSRECRKLHLRSYFRQWVRKNWDSVQAATSERRKRFIGKDPDYWKRYYAQNKERRKQERREWFEANRDRAFRTSSEYVAKNPDLIRRLGRKSAQTRRARKANAFIEVVDPQVVFERDKGVCGICSQQVLNDRWEVDHVTALANGGSHSYSNVQLAHLSCNRSKGAKVAS